MFHIPTGETCVKAKGEESNPEARSLPDETVLAENLRSTFPPLLFHLQAVKEDPFCVSIGTMRCALVCFVWEIILYCVGRQRQRFTLFSFWREVLVVSF